MRPGSRGVSRTLRILYPALAITFGVGNRSGGSVAVEIDVKTTALVANVLCKMTCDTFRHGALRDAHGNSLSWRRVAKFDPQHCLQLYLRTYAHLRLVFADNTTYSLFARFILIELTSEEPLGIYRKISTIVSSW
jgi:hypothetical protein